MEGAGRMLQAHQGYIQADGRLDLVNKLVQLPQNIKVIVLWDEESTESSVDIKPDVQEFIPQEQLTVAKNFLTAVEHIGVEGFDEAILEEFESLERGDYKLKFKERLP